MEDTNPIGDDEQINNNQKDTAITSSDIENSSITTSVRSNYSTYPANNSRIDRSVNRNFIAGQEAIRNNPNMPQFFNDALMANTPAPEAPKTSKKPLIIGTITLAVVTIVVVVVALLGSNDSRLEENLTHLRENIAVDFQNNEVSELEDSLNSLLSGEYNIANIAESGDAYQTMNDRISGLEAIKEKVNSYKFQGLSSEQKNAFNDLKSSIEKQLPLYKKMAEYYGLLYTYASKNDASSLDEISQKYNDSELASQAKEVVEAYILGKAAENDYKKYLCGQDETTDVCVTIVSRMDSYDEITYDESRIAQMFKTIIGSNSIQEDSMISKNMATLTALMEKQDE